jgi:hypothetical protein
MKRIINGTTYDTENDTFLEHYCDVDEDSEREVANLPAHMADAVALHDHLLHMTNDGQLYVFHCLRKDDDCIEPLTHEEALQWVLEHGAKHKTCTSPLDQLFPTTMVVSIRLPRDLWQRLRQVIQIGRKVPTNGLVVRLLEQELDEKQTAA